MVTLPVFFPGESNGERSLVGTVLGSAKSRVPLKQGSTHAHEEQFVCVCVSMCLCVCVCVSMCLCVCVCRRVIKISGGGHGNPLQ